MKLCFLLVAALLFASAQGHVEDNRADLLQVDPAAFAPFRDATGTTHMDSAKARLFNHLMSPDSTLFDRFESVRRLGGSDNTKKILEIVAAAQQLGPPSALSFTPSWPDAEDVFSGGLNDGEDGRCDACADTGACGRTQPLGKSFSVTVNRAAEESIIFGLCLAPELDAPDCLYAPNNEMPTYIPDDVDLIDAYVTCPINQCCNFIFTRGRQIYNVGETVNDNCTPSTCRFVERFCFGLTATFECPVGSQMMFRK